MATVKIKFGKETVTYDTDWIKDRCFICGRGFPNSRAHYEAHGNWCGCPIKNSGLGLPKKPRSDAGKQKGPNKTKRPAWQASRFSNNT